MTYQDQIASDGSVITAGYRECAERYRQIGATLTTLRRPFTVLDLGAASGYFSVRLTEDFGARCVAVDRSRDVMAAEGRVAAVVHGDLNSEQIRRQGTFDVILALSFLHHQKNWRAVLNVLLRSTRSALIVETPNPAERLKQAVARHEMNAIEAALVKAGMVRIGTSPSVWDPSIERGLWLLRRDGIRVQGHVFSGSGNNGTWVPRMRAELGALLGYEPYSGSLNVRLPRAFRLGAYAMEYVDGRRGRGARKGGDYQIWHARVEGFDGPAHVMRPGVRGHGRDVLEVWAPVKLRDTLSLSDGSTVTLRIGA